MSESSSKAAPNNPGVGTVLALTLQNDARETETINLDLAELLGDVLSASGIGNVRQDDWVVTEHDLKLLPQLANVELDDYFRTTTIEAASPRFSGIFEYQHSNSEESIEASIREGFELWCKVDLLVLHDALRSEAEDCMVMQMDIPAEDGDPAYARRIVLGPVVCRAAHAAARRTPLLQLLLFYQHCRRLYPLWTRSRGRACGWCASTPPATKTVRRWPIAESTAKTSIGAKKLW